MGWLVAVAEKNLVVFLKSHYLALISHNNHTHHKVQTTSPTKSKNDYSHNNLTHDMKQLHPPTNSMDKTQISIIALAARPNTT